MLYDCNLEQEILGNLLVSPDKITRISIKPEDFYHDVYHELFIEMQRMFAETGHFSPILLNGWARNIDFTGVDGDSYHLADIASGVLHYKNLDGHCEALKEFAKLRKLDTISKNIAQMLASEDTINADDITLNVQAQLTDTAQNSELKTKEEVYKAILEELDRPAEFNETGIPKLDKAMAGGLYKGFMYAFCGKEKAGKTTIGHTISYNLKCPHMYVALEMGSTQIEQRNVARAVGENSIEFLNNRAKMARILVAREQEIKNTMAHSPRIYYDAQGAGIYDILGKITQARIKYGIKGFIIDYWQLVGGKQKNDTEERHSRMIAQAFADYSRKHGVWCILLAQMNKDGQLFGGNGLRKACDQLYMINTCELYPDGRWLRLDASRYTDRYDLGSDDVPAFKINKQVGIHFEET